MKKSRTNYEQVDITIPGGFPTVVIIRLSQPGIAGIGAELGNIISR